ncbi:substrate-binding family protein [Biostraticola tofi]|uniref:Substrate-binding family protein n=1 Tax=Biostraticola tofi TaxID=466109 RepID=A0A4R3YUP2_9GAMM|nr:substrate-binding family protein [Biostraticola tofi]
MSRPKRSFAPGRATINAVGMREEALSLLQGSSLPMVLIDRKISDFACDVVGLDNRQAATRATGHLIDQGFEAILFLSEPLTTVNTRIERLQAFRACMADQPHLLAEEAEALLNDGDGLSALLDDCHRRHRGMRKAILSANGALTLQVARALRRLGLHWGSDIGLLGFLLVDVGQRQTVSGQLAVR